MGTGQSMREDVEGFCDLAGALPPVVRASMLPYLLTPNTVNTSWNRIIASLCVKSLDQQRTREGWDSLRPLLEN